MQFHKGPDGQLIHPLTRQAFGPEDIYPEDIYPDYETATTLRYILANRELLAKQMPEQGKEQKQENHEPPSQP